MSMRNQPRSQSFWVGLLTTKLQHELRMCDQLLFKQLAPLYSVARVWKLTVQLA